MSVQCSEFVIKGKLRPMLKAKERVPALIITLLCIARHLEEGSGSDGREGSGSDGSGNSESGAAPDQAGGAAGSEDSEKEKREMARACARCIYRVIQCWLYMRRERITKSSLPGFQKLVRRMLQDFKLAFGKSRSSNSSGFGFVKFHYNRHLAAQLRAFGSFRLSSSNRWEAAHHDFVTKVVGLA